MEHVNLGIVGVGWVAQVIHLPILMKAPEARVLAVCDRDRSRVRLVAEKHGIKGVYTDVRQMLEREDLNAVIVCTSTDAHRDTAIAALEAGRDVLVEKPIARTHAEALAMAEAAKATRRKLMVGMNHRFRPDTMLLKSFVEGKEIGKIFFTKGGWLRRRSSDSSWLTQQEKSGGGVFIDLGIVMLDMALWMMGYPEVQRVSASNYRHTTKQVEDTSIVTIALKNGARMTIEVSWSMCLDDDVYYTFLYGTEGTASINPLRIHKELHGNVVNVAPTKAESAHQLFRRSYENELKHFLGAVRDIHPVISTADEAVQRMRIVEAVYRAARLGKEVVLS